VAMMYMHLVTSKLCTQHIRMSSCGNLVTSSTDNFNTLKVQNLSLVKKYQTNVSKMMLVSKILEILVLSLAISYFDLYVRKLGVT